jgi:hypothetical protein
VAQVHPTAEKKACHSELVEESALEVTAPASAHEFTTRWNELLVPRELRPQVQILRLRFAPLRMTLFKRIAPLRMTLSFCVAKFQPECYPLRGGDEGQRRKNIEE